LARGSAALRLKDYLSLSSGAKDFRSDEGQLSYISQLRGYQNWSQSLESSISMPQITPAIGFGLWAIGMERQGGQSEMVKGNG